MTVFFTADTHFGHEAVLRHDHEWLPPGGKPFETIEDRDEYIVDQWNATVSPSDIVYHLGDFAFRNKPPIDWYLGRLHGTIHLIYGNHDQEPAKRGASSGFASQQDYLYLRLNKRRFHLFHYPCASWRGSNAGTWHLHGHCHGSMKDDPAIARWDVGIMCHRYRPVSFEEVESALLWRGGVDHHGKVRGGSG